MGAGMSVADAMELAARIVAPADGSVEEMMELRADVCGVLRAEVERLRAIIAGRTTPPTDAEIEAHAAVGGWWLYTLRGTPDEAHDVATAVRWAEHHRSSPGMRDCVWIPLLDGRPCAWPVASVVPASITAGVDANGAPTEEDGR